MGWSYAQWLAFHVRSVLAFLVVHAFTAFAMFAVRRERDAGRARQLLRFSFVTNVASQVVFLGLVVSGIVLATQGGWWAMGWPWAALLVVAVLWTLMGLWGTRSYDALRKRLRAGPGAPTAEELAALLGGVRPWRVTGLAVAGLAAVLWLMFRKPF